MPSKAIDVMVSAVRRTLVASPPRNVPAWRVLRRQWSKALRDRSAADVIELAERVLDVEPWGRVTAYELLSVHPAALSALTAPSLRRLGTGLADWASTDSFACLVAGPAWREGHVSSTLIREWLASRDRWLRRAAVVCTVALNVRARGGRGDPKRTLAVLRRVVDDHDDMVVKAVSWALRSLVEWDRKGVEEFVRTHDARLAARIKREVGTKLRTGKKNVRRANLAPG